MNFKHTLPSMLCLNVGSSDNLGCQWRGGTPPRVWESNANGTARARRGLRVLCSLGIRLEPERAIGMRTQAAKVLLQQNLVRKMHAPCAKSQPARVRWALYSNCAYAWAPGNGHTSTAKVSLSFVLLTPD
jgi:hypothetical protein